MSNVNRAPSADAAALGMAVHASAQDMVYIIDNAGIIQTGNERFWTDLGLKESPSGQLSLLASVVEAERAIALRGWKTTLSTRKSERSLRKMKGAKGELKVYSIIESPVVSDNQPTLILGVARDVTEEAAIEEKLWGAQEQTHAAQEYAIRASMGLIKGYIYSLQRLETMPAGSRERLGAIIAEEIETMGRNIENILMRRGSIQRGLQDMVFDLGEVVVESISTFKGESDRRQIPMTLEKPEHDISFFGQPLTVSRIVCSLLNCALLRITHTGEIRLRICDCDEYVEVVIADTGSDVPPVHLEQLLSAHGEPKNLKHSHVGSTFDFDIARLLTEAMGGGIIPRAGEQGGLEFTVMLPRAVHSAIQDRSNMTLQATAPQ